jgi:hypothetical protein
MKSSATGLSVRFFKVTIPNGRRVVGNSIGNRLSAGPTPGNLNTKPDRERFTWALGVTAKAMDPDAARTLIRFLSSPASATGSAPRRGGETH